jgi:hypothetical protein
MKFFNLGSWLSGSVGWAIASINSIKIKYSPPSPVCIILYMRSQALLRAGMTLNVGIAFPYLNLSHP